MELIIKAEPKEIAALVKELQEHKAYPLDLYINKNDRVGDMDVTLCTGKTGDTCRSTRVIG